MQADRDRLTRNYLGRTIVLLREAIDSSPTLADQIKTDPDIKPLESRPEFHTIMNTLVNWVGKPSRDRKDGRHSRSRS